MTLREVILYLGQLKETPRKELERRLDGWLERMELSTYKNRRVEELSKGMQQKLQFIATIVHDPELLILDEPFSGLDPVNVEVMTETILALRRRGRTVIFSTHMMDHAERLCDAILMIHRGRKVLDGPLSEIKAHAPHRAIRLTCYGEKEFVRDLPYVARMREYGNDLEVFLQPGTPPQRLLRDVVDRVEVSRFDVSDPSLSDIFLEQVAPERTHRIGADGSWVSTEPGSDAPRGAEP
jgi:ABC-2 type transport system ATP-binding protein